MDYGVNAMDGQPFVYINKEIDHGLVQALREDVIPWVDANATISAEHQRKMDADELQPRFTVVFDREGYSPDLFEEWQPRRIAVLCYHRYPRGDWEPQDSRAVRMFFATCSAGVPISPFPTIVPELSTAFCPPT